MALSCQVIGCMYSAESNYSLLQHYRRVHIGDQNFFTEDAVRKHLVKFHSVPQNRNQTGEVNVFLEHSAQNMKLNMNCIKTKSKYRHMN